jgi:hypothetical protein
MRKTPVTTRRGLTLSPETIRHLTLNQMRTVVGGVAPDETTISQAQDACTKTK